MLRAAQEIRFSATGLGRPGGVAVARDGAVYSAGEAGQIYRISPDDQHAEVIANTGGGCLGLTLNREDQIYVCDWRRRAVVRIERQRRSEVFAEATDGWPFILPNCPLFGYRGSLFVSDSGDRGGANGFIAVISGDGRSEICHPGPFHFANGLALSRCGGFLYVVESSANRVVCIQLLNGQAGAVSVFAEGLERAPDGLAFDEVGNLYVTCYASDTIYRISLDGHKDTLCADPDAYVLDRPTNCAFGGDRRDRLMIANLGGEHPSVLDMPIAGMRLWHQQEGPECG